MESDRDVPIEQVARAWNVAAEQLGIDVIAPYTLVSTENVTCAAFLRHFGGHGGMVAGLSLPPFNIDKALQTAAKANGLYYSFLNPEQYASYNEERFNETLQDWGYFGPIDRRPSWLT
jgi:hypothetical protein